MSGAQEGSVLEKGEDILHSANLPQVFTLFINGREGRERGQYNKSQSNKSCPSRGGAGDRQEFGVALQPDVFEAYSNALTMPLSNSNTASSHHGGRGASICTPSDSIDSDDAWRKKRSCSPGSAATRAIGLGSF